MEGRWEGVGDSEGGWEWRDALGWLRRVGPAKPAYAINYTYSGKHCAPRGLEKREAKNGILLYKGITLSPPFYSINLLAFDEKPILPSQSLFLLSRILSLDMATLLASIMRNLSLPGPAQDSSPSAEILRNLVLRFRGSGVLHRQADLSLPSSWTRSRRYGCRRYQGTPGAGDAKVVFRPRNPIPPRLPPPRAARHGEELSKLCRLWPPRTKVIRPLPCKPVPEQQPPCQSLRDPPPTLRRPARRHRHD